MTWDGVKYPIRASKVDGFSNKSYCVLYTIWLSAEAIDLGRPYWIYIIPTHDMHQRLQLQFLSAAEDGRKKRPKHVQ